MDVDVTGMCVACKGLCGVNLCVCEVMCVSKVDRCRVCGEGS